METLNLPLFKKIVATPGASGFEHRIRQFIMDEIRPWVDTIHIDHIGNLVAVKHGTDPKRAEHNILIAAHMDEIGLIVHHIEGNGFIRFYPLGGFDPKTLIGQRVIIHGKQDIVGVIGIKAIHFMNDEERKRPIELGDLYIDVGRSRKKLEDCITIGDPITRERELIELGDCVTGKSLDNRTGVFVLIEALRRLKTIPYDLYAVFTVQEEVGLRGAQVAAHTINPYFTLALDTSTSLEGPDTPLHKQITQLGKGAGVKLMDSQVICDPRMVSYLKQLAIENHIPWQPDMKVVGGTDTGPLQRMPQRGSIAGALTVPIRYAHQVVEVVHQQDVIAAIQLLEQAISQLHQYDWQPL